MSIVDGKYGDPFLPVPSTAEYQYKQLFGAKYIEQGLDYSYTAHKDPVTGVYTYTDNYGTKLTYNPDGTYSGNHDGYTFTGDADGNYDARKEDGSYILQKSDGTLTSYDATT